MTLFIRMPCVLALLSAAVWAQQFVQQAVLPGGSVWSEGIEVLDANGDGLMDLIVTNGQGFSSAGGSLAPTLLINQGGTTITFADETSSRIPAGFVQQGKGLAVCDVNGDGAPDVVFANGFVTQPRVLINDGTGNFSDETPTRFPTVGLNSFGIAPADVDNDGDIDLVFSDAPANFLAAPGRPPRLFINNGSGVFTDSPSRMNGVNKVGAMQVSAVDIDNDFDLDIILDGRSVGQHLYLNDGTGTFAFAGTSVLPVGSTFVYETEWGDLDNDGDIDGFYISMSGFSEGTAQNNLIQSGVLSFVGNTGTIGGVNGNDDNEAALLDANNDGLLDVLIASLNGSREKLYLNSGTFAPGSFAYQATAFPAITDSSLDLAVGDFDLDGRYDVATAQGESGNFTNRLYRNTGAADTRSPTLVRAEAVPSTVAEADIFNNDFSLRLHVTDSTADSGRTLVTVSANVQITREGATLSTTLPLTYSGGYMWRFAAPPNTDISDLVGGYVTLTFTATDGAGNTTTSAPATTRICGVNPYGTPSAVNNLSIGFSAPPTAGQFVTLSASGGPANSPVIFVFGPDRAAVPIVGGELLVDPTTLVPLYGFSTDNTGTVSMGIGWPNTPNVGGTLLRYQVAMMDPAQLQGWSASTGIEAAVCGS